MARGRSGGGNKPGHGLSFSYKSGKKDYENLSLTGLWKNEDAGPVMRGSLDEERVKELIDYLEDFLKGDAETVSAQIWDNEESEGRGRGRDRNDDRDRDRTRGRSSGRGRGSERSGEKEEKEEHGSRRGRDKDDEPPF